MNRSTSGPPQIPGYDYLRDLGRGGFSDVYLYEQQMPKRQVAVKVLRHDTLDERQRQSFTDEANTMAQLADHPNIVSVLSAAIAGDGRPYLVMTYYPGDDLGRRVADRPLGLAAALRTAIQLSCAVETAHRIGVLHRDIKPANVLIGRSGAPGLTDFGIAGNVHTLHESDEVGVSIPWSAPEVLAGRSNGTVASDVYALGATLWHLLVGRSPFRVPGGDNSQGALVSRVLRSPAPRTGQPEVPDGLERLLAQCLAKDPTHRPRSALQLARELQQVELRANLSRTDLVVLDHEVPAHEPAPLVTGLPDDDAGNQATVGKTPTVLSPAPQDVDAEPATVGRPTRSPQDEAPATVRRPSDTPSTAPPDERPGSGPAGRPAAIAALVVLLGVAATMAVVFLTNGGGDDASDGPSARETTQQPPGALTEAPPPAPSPQGTAGGGRATFTWDEVAGAVSYLYYVGDADSPQPSEGTSASVPFRGARSVCVRVFGIGSTGAQGDLSAKACVTKP